MSFLNCGFQLKDVHICKVCSGMLLPNVSLTMSSTVNKKNVRVAPDLPVGEPSLRSVAIM